MKLLHSISRLVQERASAMESKPREPAELIEKRNGDIADQSTALRTLVGVQSWPDIALSAIEEGDEAFAGEIVGLVEQRLRRMS